MGVGMEQGSVSIGQTYETYLSNNINRTNLAKVILLYQGHREDTID